jgi:hypothetical protein
VDFARRERDHRADRVDVLGAAKRRPGGAGLDDAKDVLVVRMRRESLTRVAGTEELERLEHANPRHRCRLGCDRSLGHHWQG